MNQSQIKTKILELLNADLTQDGEKIKNNFATEIASIFTETVPSGGIELVLDDSKNVMHRERALSDDETLVFLAYKYIHKSSKGKGRGKYKRNSTRWRIQGEVKPSIDFVYPSVEGKKIESSKLAFNKYSQETRKKTKGFTFVRYAIAIIKYTGNDRFPKGTWEIHEMRTFKVSGIGNKFNGCNIE